MRRRALNDCNGVFEPRVDFVIELLHVLRHNNIVFELHSQASPLPLLYNEQLLSGRSSGLIELRFHLPCQNHYPWSRLDEKELSSGCASRTAVRVGRENRCQKIIELLMNQSRAGSYRPTASACVCPTFAVNVQTFTSCSRPPVFTFNNCQVLATSRCER